MITIGCAALLVAATHEEWSDTETLINVPFVPDRTPFLMWLVLTAMLPIGVTVVLAVRGSYAAQVALATVATLGVLNYLAEAGWNGNEHTHNETTWARVAVAHLLMAAAAWSAVIARARSAPPAQ